MARDGKSVLVFRPRNNACRYKEFDRADEFWLLQCLACGHLQPTERTKGARASETRCFHAESLDLRVKLRQVLRDDRDLRMIRAKAMQENL